MGWHAGDTYPSIGSLSPSAEPSMTNLYDMLSGIPFLGLGGAERIDEIAMGDPSSDTYLSHNIKPFDMHNDDSWHAEFHLKWQDFGKNLFVAKFRKSWDFGGQI